MAINTNIIRQQGESDAAFKMRQLGLDPNKPIQEEVVDINNHMKYEQSLGDDTSTSFSNTYTSAIQDLNADTLYDQSLDGAEEIDQTKKKSWLKKNAGNLAKGSIYALNAGASYNNEVNATLDYENSMRKRMQQDPIYDYNNMYGDNQPLIKAEDGMQVRTKGSKAMPINIEGGEFLILADGTTELAKGPKHSKGGIPTILPDKSIVFSNKLKPEGEKKTFAQIAKSLDYAKHSKVLSNPYSSEVDRISAERMLARNQKSLIDLFKRQQDMNNDSSGEIMADGGFTDKFEDGLPIAMKPIQNPAFEKRMRDGRKIDNADGTYSTHKMMSWSDDKGFYAAPTIVDIKGKLTELSADDAIKHAYKTGDMRKFKTDKEAQDYANNGYKKSPMEFSKGGKIKYEKGGEYDMDDEEIEQLKKQGYKIEIL